MKQKTDAFEPPITFSINSCKRLKPLKKRGLIHYTADKKGGRNDDLNKVIDNSSISFTKLVRGFASS